MGSFCVTPTILSVGSWAVNRPAEDQFNEREVWNQTLPLEPGAKLMKLMELGWELAALDPI